jgi:hypothetical protein
MPKDGKTTPAQAARAARLRTLIEGAPAQPKTPREFTDDAARKKWEESQKQKKVK